MSLTIFIHNSAPVAIVRWFLDAKSNVIFASGPVVQVPLEEFRATGYDWVHRHFEEYRTVRLTEKQVVPVFRPGEAETLMKNRRAVQIGRYPDGTLLFSPKVIQKCDLACLEPVSKEARRTIPENSSPATFWKAFDEALSESPVNASA